VDPYDDVPESEWPGKRRRGIDGPQRRAYERPRATDGELRGAYRVLRAQFLRRCAAARAECHFGDGPLDYTVAHTDPRAATVHHTIAQRTRLKRSRSFWSQ